MPVNINTLVLIEQYVKYAPRVSIQRELFQSALSHIGKRDLINAVLEVDLAGGTATCREYSYPLS